MRITDFLVPERILLNLRVRGKAQLLAEIARHFARIDPSLEAGTIEAALAARERLGSTGLGDGFALPHARIDAVTAYQAMFVRLHRPIPFEAIDAAPVSMVFVLLIPGAETGSHVAALAAISRLFRAGDNAAALRRAPSVEAACEVFASQ